MKIITDKDGNVKNKQNRGKNDKEIEVADNSFGNKNLLNYKVIKSGNKTTITPKSKKELKKTFRENTKNAKTIEEKMNLVIDYLGLG